MEKVGEGSLRFGSRLCRLLLLVVVAGMVLIVSGCLEAEVNVTVKDDSSGVVIVEVYPDESVLDRIGGTDMKEAVTGALTEVPGYEFKDVKRAGHPGYRITVPFDDYRTFEDTLVSGGTFLGRQISLFSSFDLRELPGGDWKLDATIRPASEIIVGGDNGPFGVTVDDLIKTGGRAGAGTGMTLSIALPGRIVYTNATTRDGGTATWDLKEATAATHLEMRTEPKPLLTGLQWLMVGAGAAIVVGLVLVLMGAQSPYRANKPRKPKKSPYGKPEDKRWRRKDRPAPAAAAPTQPTGDHEENPLPPMSVAASAPVGAPVEAPPEHMPPDGHTPGPPP